MEKPLQLLQDIFDQPYQWLAEYKKTAQKKVMGCFPMHCPEEIVHAAGLLPVVLQRKLDRMIFSPSLMQVFFCDYGRGIVDLVESGALDFLDGIVFANTCFVDGGISHMMQLRHPSLRQYYVNLPQAIDQPLYKDFLLKELEQFRTDMGSHAGDPISDAALRESIKVYDDNRALLRKMRDIRKSRPGLIRAREMLAMVVSSMVMPKEEHSRVLTDLLPEIERRKTIRSNGVRLVLSGCMCESIQVEVLDLIEEAGGIIVDDDLYAGSRYFAYDHHRKSESPLEELAARHFNPIPGPTRYNPQEDWGDYLVDSVRRCGAEAVIFVLVLHCEPHLYAYPPLKKKLEAAGIPSLALEIEQESLSLARMRTRIEAFYEMVRGGART